HGFSGSRSPAINSMSEIGHWLRANRHVALWDFSQSARPLLTVRMRDSICKSSKVSIYPAAALNFHEDGDGYNAQRIYNTKSMILIGLLLILLSYPSFAQPACSKPLSLSQVVDLAKNDVPNTRLVVLVRTCSLASNPSGFEILNYLTAAGLTDATIEN